MGLFDGLQPFLRRPAQRLLNLAGPNASLTSVRRSPRQQALLFRRYQAGLSKFPAAPPGTSKHELGLAFDIWSPDAQLLRDLGATWESWGGVWGGRFNDPIHFEAPRGRPASRLRSRRPPGRFGRRRRVSRGRIHWAQ